MAPRDTMSALSDRPLDENEHDSDSESIRSNCSSASIGSSSTSSEEEGKTIEISYPYEVGDTFRLKRHSPHRPPFGYGYGYRTPWPSEWDTFKELSQVEYCLQRSPLPGTGTPDSETQDIIITSHVQIGYGGRAQVVLVKFRDLELVAKIYDPMYYEGVVDNGMFGYNKLDVVCLADADYSSETAAYEELQNSAQALNYIPKYYGSWTMDVETPLHEEDGNPPKREVRLVLLEVVKGTSMLDIDPKRDISKPIRNKILEKVIETEAIIYHAGVTHNDFAPRNVILVGDVDNDKLKVVLIDFNMSITHRYTGHIRVHQTLMENPVSRHWGELGEFIAAGWLSGVGNAAENWLWRHFQNDKQDKYIPMEMDGKEKLAKFRCGRPRMVKVEEEDQPVLT